MENTQPLFSNHTIPTRFADFYQRHAGESILVCGCGSSLNQLHEAEHYTTIGVNDIGRKFHPDYLVVLNGRHQFTEERFTHIASSQAQAIFTHLQLGISHPNIVRFLLGQRGGVEVSDTHSLPYTRNSTYVAACLAIFMGAKRIGLIGVDFTEHHFFAQSGRHSLSGELSHIRQEYARLAEASSRHGVEIVNLSATSAVDTLPYQPLAEFARQAKSTKSLNIVSYATTPVVGVPKLLSECIEHCTPHRCRTVWATHQYGNGVQFEREVEWQQQPDIARSLLEAADLVIVHNGYTAPQHNAIFKDKPVITLAHNYMRNVNQQFVNRGMPGMVVAQYQASLPEFAQWRAVPNPVPLWNPLFDSAEKETPIAIAYTPSVRHDEYPAGHRLYWHSKGYHSTMAILKRLARHYPLQLLTIQSGQVSFSQSMAMKRRAHIVIDECVTGSYHRNSLEGLAAGAVVINGLGLKSDISAVLQQCTGNASSPFVCASLDTLEAVLTELIKLGPQRLSELGARNRTWLQQHWDFSAQWRQFWLPALQQALGKDRPAMQTVRRQQPNSAPSVTLTAPLARLITQPNLSTGVSVIIPFAGKSRLMQLQAVLKRLKNQTDVRRVIVVELDQHPNAQTIASQLADDYLFALTEKPFSKSRAMNIALPFVRTQHLLWLDSDLLLPPDFVRQAREECEMRQLDCLITWNTVYFLTQEDSQQVQLGQRAPDDCPPEHQLRKGAQGGAVLVRTDFVMQHGGMPEQFQGWGGEDNAWFHKVSVLGKIDYTGDRQRVLYHLYHPMSSGYCRQGEHIAANPHYRDNVQLLRRMRAARHPTTFNQQYPAPRQHSAPWDGQQAIVYPPSHKALAQRLRDFYGDALRFVQQPESQAIDLGPFSLLADELSQTVLEVIKHICETRAGQIAATPAVKPEKTLQP
ncbi:hypothetical protein DDT52_17225 [Brenneria roseae subsp. roseae]|uniref:glycosyltransferase n=1 Tax=Brenneria roseae TaxID=1509241 RepID=UPI000D60479A|nr:glycosyltransferase [Brenneria roseae]PWC17026.1 hypothetical protein DDT52_17225 [Brenneria roseae subsp. roseae]